MGWTSIYQLFCGSLGTRVMTHSQMSCQFFWWRNSNKFSMGFWIPWGGFDKAQNQMMPCQKGIKIVKLCPAFGQSHKYHMVGCIFPVYIYIYLYIPIIPLHDQYISISPLNSLNHNVCCFHHVQSVQSPSNHEAKSQKTSPVIGWFPDHLPSGQLT